MRKLLNPWWLFLINTLPVCILFFLYISQYSIIHTELEPENIRLWKIFGGILAGMALLNAAYTVYLILRKKAASLWYAIAALSGYTGYLYVLMVYYDDMITWSVPGWMVPDSLPLYPITFLMPTLAYALAELVYKLTPAQSSRMGLYSLIGAIAIPLLFYFYVNVLSSFWHPDLSRFGSHAIVLLILAVTIGFLFLLFRATYIAMFNKSEWFTKYALAWKIPIAIIFPLLGLAFNQGLLFSSFSFDSIYGIFGNFSDEWFFVLAAVNGVLLCLPSLNKPVYRLLVFIGKSITLAYTAYFLLVFLPYLPLSIIAIVLVGLGFLMLTPPVLMVVHVREMGKDLQYLSGRFSKKLLIAISFAGFMVLPVCITLNYLHDRQELHALLDYMYTPDYNKVYEPDKESILRVIKNSRKAKQRGITLGMPYLSSYYRWLVLDNLVLSNTKMEKIERIFDLPDHVGLRQNRTRLRNKEVCITQADVTSRYDEKDKSWKSWVDLEITNFSQELTTREYATTIDLPPGCYISDYYLYVGDRKEPGILAEKKSAMWIFSQIRNYRRDPGILYYLTGDRVAFWVFPFLQKEVRRTGIEFVHKEPVELALDDYTLSLGEKAVALQGGRPEITETDHALYVPVAVIDSLPPASRKPYYHFIVDASQQAGHESIIRAIENMDYRRNAEKMTGARISMVNSRVTTFDYAEDWADRIRETELKDGFFADRGIRQALALNYMAKGGRYPELIVVSNSIQSGVWDDDFSDLWFAYPEGDTFYNLQSDGGLIPHLLTSQPSEPVRSDSLTATGSYEVAELDYGGHTYYLRRSGQAGVVLKEDLFTLPETSMSEKSWESALSLRAKQMSYALHPEASDDEWLRMVKYSFLSKIMIPATSYIVVETEAQRAMLKKKQEEVLSGNPSLDPGEDAVRMSEPTWYVLAALLAGFIYLRHRRQRKRAA
ncbi:MAG: MSEP-CTERM sorting domain-containing protein [Cyclobacteriaceae bacterium]